MTTRPKDAVSASEPTGSMDLSPADAELVSQCEAAMAEFVAQRDECLRRVQELLKAEDPAKGLFYAKDIHDTQQDKLRLDVEIEF